MNKYIKVYDKENHERKFIERVSGIDVIVSKDIIIDRYEKELQQKENIIKEVREYIEENWIDQKDADYYRFDDAELSIEISDIAVLFNILDKGE